MRQFRGIMRLDGCTSSPQLSHFEMKSRRDSAVTHRFVCCKCEPLTGVRWLSSSLRQMFRVGVTDRTSGVSMARVGVIDRGCSVSSALITMA